MSIPRCNQLRWVVAGSLIVGVLVFGFYRSRSPKVIGGPALPRGKVQAQLGLGWDHGYLLAPDGSLWRWGEASFNSGLITNKPRRIGLDSDWKQLGVARMPSGAGILGLKTDGSLWGWGANTSGQLGLGTTQKMIALPVMIGTTSGWLEIRAGAAHCLALKNDRSLWAWGQNDKGQIGDGGSSNKTAPYLISEERDWKFIEAGSFSSYAVKESGALWGWGYGHSGVLKPINGGTEVKRIAAGDHHLAAVKNDGTLWILGLNAHVAAAKFLQSGTSHLVQVGQDKDWVHVYSGTDYFLARKADGSWWGCGRNFFGQLGLGFRTRRYPTQTQNTMPAPARLPYDFNPMALAAGVDTTALLAEDGSLWVWGKRLGEPKRNAVPLNQFRRKLNAIARFLPVNDPLFLSEDFTVDVVPQKIWEWPQPH